MTISRFPVKLAVLVMLACSLSACDDISVYGGIGIGAGYSSVGFNSYHRGSGMSGSVSIGGRIR